jgi:hypothetical protein
MKEQTPVPLPNPSDVRAEWLGDMIDREQKRYPVMKLSTQGLLLLIDIEKAFCAGAWLSVIVLSYAVVDATLRDVTSGDYKSPASELYGGNRDLDWLRNLRNQIVHVGQPGNQSALWKLAPYNLPECHAALEEESKRAVMLAYRQVYAQDGM